MIYTQQKTYFLWLLDQIVWGFRLFAEMQIISYILMFLKHIQVDSQFWKLLMLRVQFFVIFLEDSRY